MMTHLPRRRMITAVVAATVAVLASTAPAGAATSPLASPPLESMSAPTSVVTDAQSARQQAIALRKDVSSLLTTYTGEYADRFTAAELAQLNGYRDDADRQLASVVVTTSRLARVAGKRGSQRSLSQAQSSAWRSWTRAKQAAETSWDSARTIMEPKLGLLERLSALSDYNAMMARFDRLGDTLRGLER